MRRTLFDDTHEEFRSAFRSFLDREAVPNHERWEADGIVDRQLFEIAGANGFLGMEVPEEYGGGGV
ncbi:MAG: acyl-CoA dehydrogenase family protein, partial [Ilumatobacteraceae bacterium]